MKHELAGMGIADRIAALRLEAGSSELELAEELGITVAAYCGLEQQNSEFESVLSIAQALQLAKLLRSDLLGVMGEPEPTVKVSIARVRAALAAHLGTSAETREVLEDQIDWDVGPFLEGAEGWTSVYTLEFIKKLAGAIEVEWPVLLVALEKME